MTSISPTVVIAVVAITKEPKLAWLIRCSMSQVVVATLMIGSDDTEGRGDGNGEETIHCRVELGIFCKGRFFEVKAVNLSDSIL